MRLFHVRNSHLIRYCHKPHSLDSFATFDLDNFQVCDLLLASVNLVCYSGTWPLTSFGPCTCFQPFSSSENPRSQPKGSSFLRSWPLTRNTELTPKMESFGKVVWQSSAKLCPWLLCHYRHNPKLLYSEVSPIVFSWAYFQESVHRISAYGMFLPPPVTAQ